MEAVIQRRFRSGDVLAAEMLTDHVDHEMRGSGKCQPAESSKGQVSRHDPCPLHSEPHAGRVLRQGPKLLGRVLIERL